MYVLLKHNWFGPDSKYYYATEDGVPISMPDAYKAILPRFAVIVDSPDPALRPKPKIDEHGIFDIERAAGEEMDRLNAEADAQHKRNLENRTKK